jgi:hypothetical protein
MLCLVTNPLVIGPFLSMEVLRRFSEMFCYVGIIGDQAGELGDVENTG